MSEFNLDGLPLIRKINLEGKEAHEAEVHASAIIVNASENIVTRLIQNFFC